jgi:ABC-type dipeptide/oligopeptide/nickel transport system ATPase component
MSVLEIRDLKVSVKLPDGELKPILDGVTLTIKAGETHAIMGPNGSGKSTLAYSIAGHPKYVITDGSVTLDGVDVLAMTVDERARAGLFLAMQHPVEVPGVSVANFLRTAKTSPSTTVVGKTGTGWVAGGPVGLPLRRSKREPCSAHSIVQPSTSPSDSGTSACEQTSSMAKTSSPTRTTATSMSASSTRSELPAVRSASAHNRVPAAALMRPRPAAAGRRAGHRCWPSAGRAAAAR